MEAAGTSVLVVPESRSASSWLKKRRGLPAASDGLKRSATIKDSIREFKVVAVKGLRYYDGNSLFSGVGRL